MTMIQPKVANTMPKLFLMYIIDFQIIDIQYFFPVFPIWESGLILRQLNGGSLLLSDQSPSSWLVKPSLLCV